MDISVKTYYNIIKAILFLAILGTVVFGIYNAAEYIQNYTTYGSGKVSDLQAKLDESNRKFVRIEGELKDSQNVVRSQTTVVSSLKDDISNLKQERGDLIATIKKNEEKITNLGEIKSKLEGDLTDLRKKPDHVYKAGTGDPNEQYFKKVFYRYKDDKGAEQEIPVAWTIFYPNKPEEEKWKTGIYPLDYYVRIVQAEQKTGQTNTYAEVWFENTKDKQSRELGLKAPITIEKSEFKQLKVTDKQMFWWAPHLGLSVDGYYGSNVDQYYGAGLDFSFSGYGRTRNDLTWRFFDFGASYNGDGVYFKFAPFLYNIGEHIPFISNTYIGPFIGIDTNTNWLGGLTLSVTF